MGTRFRFAIALTLIASLFATALSASAQDTQYQDFANEEFENVWARTDLPVEQHVEPRTWIWGPGANTGLLEEPYAEATDGVRQVQYTDKSRMELPWDGGDPDSPWYISQGLLATELMTGMLQVGDEDFEQHEPADIPVAGDPDDTTGPTYAEMGEVMDLGARNTGWGISQVLHRDGTISDNGDLLAHGVTDAYYISETGHNIASVFWDFMNSTGTIYEDGQYVDGPIFQNAFYAVGFPLTEAYWAQVKVDNVVQDVLVQCFERRCLTFTPGNQDGWQVESGNIGQHYYNWRYNIIDEGEDEPEDPPVADSFSVSPASATNPVDEEHEITVTVEDQYGDPFEGAEVSAEVTEGPHDGTQLEPDDATTGANGVATLDYEGDTEGTDTIEVTVDGIDDSQTVTKTWAEYSLSLDPSSATNRFETEHEVTATVHDGDNDQVNITSTTDVEVSIDRDFDDPDSDDVMLDTSDVGVDIISGEAVISYTGPDEAATDTIEVTVDVNGVDVSASATKTWAETIQIALEPEDDENLYFSQNDIDDLQADLDVDALAEQALEDAGDSDYHLGDLTDDEQEIVADYFAGLGLPVTFDPLAVDYDSLNEHTVIATVTDDGQAVTDGEVQFEVTGENEVDDAEPVELDENGQARFTYESEGVSEDDGDVITATLVDVDPEVSAEATKTWVAFEREPAALELDLWQDHPNTEQHEVNSLGDRHHVVATVTDQFLLPMSGVSVTFSLDGPNDPVAEREEYGTFDPDASDPGDTIVDQTTGDTNSNGRIGFLYEGENLGDDTINAEVTDNTDISDTSPKEWVENIVRFTSDEVNNEMGCDRECPSGGTGSVSAFGRDDVLKVNINSQEANENHDDGYDLTEGAKTPYGPTDNFVDGEDFGTAIEVDLYIDPDWQDKNVRAGVWAMPDDGQNGTEKNAPGIIEFANLEQSSGGSPQLDTEHEGFRIWDSEDGWVEPQNEDFAYGEWVTLRVELHADIDEFVYYIDGDQIGTGVANSEATFIRNVLFNSYNFGLHEFDDPENELSNESYSVHWHNLLTNL